MFSTRWWEREMFSIRLRFCNGEWPRKWLLENPRQNSIRRKHVLAEILFCTARQKKMNFELGIMKSEFFLHDTISWQIKTKCTFWLVVHFIITIKIHFTVVLLSQIKSTYKILNICLLFERYLNVIWTKWLLWTCS